MNGAHFFKNNLCRVHIFLSMTNTNANFLIEFGLKYSLGVGFLGANINFL